MLSDNIMAWLEQNSHVGSLAYVASTREQTRRTLASHLVPESCELAFLYLNFGPDSVRGCYELNGVDELGDWTAYAHEELGVPKPFLALTSIEGNGIDLYHRESEAVYDVEFGQFEDLEAGTLKPIATSFSKFLEWCMAQEDEA